MPASSLPLSRVQSLSTAPIKGDVKSLDRKQTSLMLASSFQRSSVPSAPRNADLKSLEVDSKGDLEWRVSEISARWLLAGRDVVEEDPSMTQSDVIAWKIRVAGLVFYAAFQMFGCTVGVLFSVMTGFAKTMYICIAQMLAVVLVLVSTHIANRSMKVSLQRTADVSTLMVVVICLFGTTFLWPLHSTFRGWHWSTGVTVWQWASAMGPVLLFENHIRTASAIFSIAVAMDALLIASSRMWVGKGPIDGGVQREDTDTFGYSMLSGLSTYAMVPLLVALFFRVRQQPLDCDACILFSRLHAPAALQPNT